MNILLPLAITLAVESIIYMLFYRFNKIVFIITSILNLILNPIMNLALSAISDQTIYWILLAVAEVATITIESLTIFLYFKKQYPKALLASFSANAASFLIGLAFFNIYNMKITPIILVIVFFLIYIFVFIFVFFIKKNPHHLDGDPL